MCVDVEWNMNGEPEWKDDKLHTQDVVTQDVVTQDNLAASGKEWFDATRGWIVPREIEGIKTLYIPTGEYWVLLRTMDGWRLVTDKPLLTLEKAKENIQHRSPGAYKILHTTESYKTQVALLPLSEE